MDKKLDARTALLKQLLFVEDNFESISNKLKQFDWECKDELVSVDKKVLDNLFQGFLNGKYSLNTLERWADLVECREDIDYEDNNLELIKEVLGTLANKDIATPVDEKVIRGWVNRLR